jgi:cytochrome c oxidase subunit 2
MPLAQPFGYLAGSALASLLVGGVPWPAPPVSVEAAVTQEGDTTTRRSFAIVARKYDFSPGQIEVTEGDLVKIELRSADIAHSFTVDSYRIARRVGAGGTTVFEFRADKTGTFPFYCNITSDDGCRAMRGQLVVRPRR